MQLLVSPTSPFARKVRVMLIEKDISEDVVEVVYANPWTNLAGLIDHNPLNKVPVFIEDNGDKIYESSVITDRVDAIDSAVQLIPGGQLRTYVKSVEALTTGAIESAAAPLMGQRVAGAPLPEVWVKWHMDKVSRTVEHLNQTIAKSADFFVGSSLTVADITVCCLLGFLDFRHQNFDWRSGHSELSQWYLKQCSRRALKETIPVA